MTTPLTIAVSKGYLYSEAVKLLNKQGYIFKDNLSLSRKLFTDDTTGTLRLLLIRPWDVPVYVETGAADIGITGKDVLLEQSPQILQLLDLKFGTCKLIIAGTKKAQKKGLFQEIRVATKYPASTQKYFNKLGIKANIIKLYGAIELAPITGISDIIVDLTATGKTLKEKKLAIMATLFSSSAHLIANPISFKRKYASIVTLTNGLKKALA